ncbi:MAG: N-acetyl-gamma-glutamyl-phosphate reductase [Desulfobacterium sp.]|nr:N-acetyl-gamma-glutamyl-phosphate reductase [Desulfobacterium sp.]
MIRVGILGSTGYAGAELVRILLGHPDAKITIVTSRQYAGVSFSEVYPSMRGIMDIPCEEYHIDRIIKNTDVVFTALPHKLPMAFVPELIENNIKVIDLSADFRFRNVAVYEKHYQQHIAGRLSESAVYGLSEINSEMIQKASLIGNPGCYPTSLLLPLIPLVENKMVMTDSIIADAKSGVSGAGRSISLDTHFCEVNESFKAYKVSNHRHTPEMEENLSIAAKEPVQITFVPHLVPITRGMLTTIYANIVRNVSEADIRDCLESYYQNRYFVRICKEGAFPNVSNVRTTNFCDIGLKVDSRNNRIILVSAIDNLMKGAAGQAVQNMNLMMGLDERKGLESVPLPV